MAEVRVDLSEDQGNKTVIYLKNKTPSSFNVSSYQRSENRKIVCIGRLIYKRQITTVSKLTIIIQSRHNQLYISRYAEDALRNVMADD